MSINKGLILYLHDSLQTKLEYGYGALSDAYLNSYSALLH